MTYVLGAILGAVLGSAAGYIKNRIIWVKYMNSEAVPEKEEDRIYTRMLASNFTNIAVLTAIFFLRNLQPFNGIAFLVGGALALAFMNKAILLGQKKHLDQHISEGSNEEYSDGSSEDNDQRKEA